MNSIRQQKEFTRSNSSGFTLIEMIVYVGVLAIILVGLVHMVLAVSSTFNEIRAARQLNHSAFLFVDRFVREVRDADSVTTGASTFDAHPGEVTVNTGGTSVRFYIDNGVLKLDRGGSYEGDLTVPGVSVDSIIFRHMDSTLSELVRLEVTLTSTSGKASRTETFYTSAVTRGAYAE